MVKPWLIYNNPALWKVDFNSVVRTDYGLCSSAYQNYLPTPQPPTPRKNKKQTKKITNSTRVHDWGIIGVVTPKD